MLVAWCFAGGWGMRSAAGVNAAWFLENMFTSRARRFGGLYLGNYV